MPKWQGRKFKPHDRKARVPESIRPTTKFTVANVTAIVSCLKLDWTKEEACVLGNISTVTFDDWYANERKMLWEIEGGTDKDGKPIWRKRMMTFKQIIDAAYVESTMRCRKSLYSGVDSNPRLALDVLQLRDPRYSPKQDVQIAGNMTVLFGKQNQFLKQPDEVNLWKVQESQPEAKKAKTKK